MSTSPLGCAVHAGSVFSSAKTFSDWTTLFPKPVTFRSGTQIGINSSACHGQTTANKRPPSYYRFDVQLPDKIASQFGGLHFHIKNYLATVYADYRVAAGGDEMIPRSTYPPLCLFPLFLECPRSNNIHNFVLSERLCSLQLAFSCYVTRIRIFLRFDQISKHPTSYDTTFEPNRPWYEDLLDPYLAILRQTFERTDARNGIDTRKHTLRNILSSVHHRLNGGVRMQVRTTLTFGAVKVSFSASHIPS